MAKNRMVVVTFDVTNDTEGFVYVDSQARPTMSYHPALRIPATAIRRLEWLRENGIKAVYSGRTNHSGKELEYWLLWDSAAALMFKMVT
jgi:hypothetical protein